MRIKDTLCFLLLFILLFTWFCYSEDEYDPVKYVCGITICDYSEEVDKTTIRFVSQKFDTADRYGWGKYSTDKSYTYGPATNCTSAVQSMAFSYIGINATPEAIVSQPTNFRTNYGFEEADTAYRIGNSASAQNLDRFLDVFFLDGGNGYVSPVIIHYQNGETGSALIQHSVLVIGKNDEGQYIAVDPAEDWDNCIRTFSLHRKKGKSYITGDVARGDGYAYLDAIEQYNLLENNETVP